MASASVSWALRDSRRTQRPNATSGSTISGIASSTKPDSRGLVITIIAVAPMNSIRLRSAIETEAPTADLICVVSAVSREISSPRARGIEERRRQRHQVREHVAPEIGDDALADRHHQVVARGAGQREHRDHRDHHAEIAVDQRDAFRREAEVDHPPHRDRHHQRRDRGDRQRDRGRERRGRDSAPHKAPAPAADAAARLRLAGGRQFAFRWRMLSVGCDHPAAAAFRHAPSSSRSTALMRSGPIDLLTPR